MARIGRFLGGAVAMFAALAAGPTMGQRIHFPTAIPTNTASSVAQIPAPGYWSAPAPVYSTAPQAAPSYAPGVSPAYPPPTTPSYAPGVTPAYPPGAYPPGVAPSYALPGPTATFQGSIQPPATWDPYAAPGLQAPSLLPQDPCLPPAPAFVYPAPSGTIQTMKKFLQEVNLDYIWMPGNGPQELGIHDVDLSASFAIPFLYNPDRPLLVTPGFAIHFWNGPSVDLNPPPSDWPPRTYDAYLDGAWNPQITQILGAELAVRVGVYSDFTKLTNQSVRYQGKGLVVFSFSPGVQVKAGVMYLDRERIKLFPTGGLVWSPNPDLRFEIIFPNPKLAARLKSYGNTEWWAYFRGDYGGGSWTVKGINDGVTDETGIVRPRDYSDTRAAVGLEFDSLSGMDGLFEVGIAFEREIYGNGGTLFAPNSTVFVGAGLSY